MRYRFVFFVDTFVSSIVSNDLTLSNNLTRYVLVYHLFVVRMIKTYMSRTTMICEVILTTLVMIHSHSNEDVLQLTNGCRSTTPGTIIHRFVRVSSNGYI